MILGRNFTTPTQPGIHNAQHRRLEYQKDKFIPRKIQQHIHAGRTARQRRPGPGGVLAQEMFNQVDPLNEEKAELKKGHADDRTFFHDIFYIEELGKKAVEKR